MKTALTGVAIAILALSGCASERAPSEAEIVQTLPVVTTDSALAAFQKVCVASKPDFASATSRQAALSSPNAYLFTVDALGNGAPLCSMRARLDPSLDAFQELRRRYGSARQPRGGSPILSVFNDYPGGQLIFQPGIANGAGEGTFQIGLVNGVEF